MRTSAVLKNLAKGQAITGAFSAISIIGSAIAMALLPRDVVNIKGVLIIAVVALIYTALYYGTGISQNKRWLLASDLFYMPTITVGLNFLGPYAPYFFYLYLVNLAMDAAIYDLKNYRIATGIIIVSAGMGVLANSSMQGSIGFAVLLAEWMSILLLAPVFWLYSAAAAEERTKRVAAEKEALRLADLERMKGDFLALASHEMRTPLGHIKGYAEILKTKHDNNAISRIDANVDRLLKLVSQMLKVSQISSERDTLQLVAIDQLLEEVSADIFASVKEKRITFMTTTFPHTLVRSNKTELREAMQNILENAVKYTPEGGRIDLKTSVDKGFFVLSITDTGIGIPEKEKSQIFKKFYRASNAEALDPSGTGLGLYMVKQIIGKYGGSVSLESRLGQGTKITITLPVHNVSLDQPTLSQA